jgi:nucleoside-diphosphate-sugar epimerase
VYNVGTGRGTTLLELLDVLSRILGTDRRPEHGPPGAGDIRHSRADIRRARQDLGYEPTVSLQEGLEQTVRWYRETPAAGGA